MLKTLRKIPQCLKRQNPDYGKFYRSNILVSSIHICKKKERSERRIFEPGETSQPNFKNRIRLSEKYEHYKTFNTLRIYCTF